MPQGYISSPQTTQGQSLTLAVTPKDAIVVDSEDETDFEILDSSDIQYTPSKSCNTMPTKVEKHVHSD